MRANPNRILSPGRTKALGHDQHGWTASEREIKELMGLPKKLPKTAVAPQIIQGVKVWVNAAVVKTRVVPWSGKTVNVKSSTHRVMAQCPQCGWTGSAGRLAQHTCKDHA